MPGFRRAASGFAYRGLNPNVTGATSPSGSRWGLVGRPQGLEASVFALFGTPAMRALLALQSEAVAAALSRDLEIQIRFGPTESRSAAKNAVIGLAHATGAQGKGAPFLEAARREARKERGADEDERGAHFLPIRNPYYMRQVERQTYFRLLRDGLMSAVAAGAAQAQGIFRAAYERGARYQMEQYGEHFAEERMLKRSPVFTGTTPLSPRYRKIKIKRWGFEHPILTASGELRSSLLMEWVSG